MLLDDPDPLHSVARAAPVHYVRLVRREIRGRERFFCQLVCAGRPPVKHPARRDGPVRDRRRPLVGGGRRPGTATSQRHKLAPGADQAAKARRRVPAPLDRQRRANNPTATTAGAGRSAHGGPGRRSGRMRRTETPLRETQRKLAARRRNEHGRLANQLLAEPRHGRARRADQLPRVSARRSAARCATGRPGSSWPSSNAKPRASRRAARGDPDRAHVPLAALRVRTRGVRKTLSERRHRCGCEHVPAGFYADRDELAAFLACFCDEQRKLRPATPPWRRGKGAPMIASCGPTGPRAGRQAASASPRQGAPASGSERFGRQAPTDPGDAAAHARPRKAARPRTHHSGDDGGGQTPRLQPWGSLDRLSGRRPPRHPGRRHPLRRLAADHRDPPQPPRADARSHTPDHSSAALSGGRRRPPHPATPAPTDRRRSPQRRRVAPARRIPRGWPRLPQRSPAKPPSGRRARRVESHRSAVPRTAAIDPSCRAAQSSRALSPNAGARGGGDARLS